jgi:hypothetical protein
VTTSTGGLAAWSYRPQSCPYQAAPAVEVLVCELSQNISDGGCGRWLVYELIPHKIENKLTRPD